MGSQQYKNELKLKDEQCEKLSRVRNELESELEELTASLFQEAHAMVRAAKVKQAAAEKRFKEANNKVDVLQAEVSALKHLVLTSTSSPGHSRGMGWRRHSTEHLSPCPDCDSYDCDAAVARFNGACLQGPRHAKNSLSEEPEVDVILFREFLQWMDERSVSHDQPFLARIYKEDVGPCLNFPNKELALAVHSAIENNTLMMETFTGKPVFRKCTLTGTSRFCLHRVKLSEKGDWYNLSRNSRVRIVAVCDFYTYVRYIQQGLVKADVTEIYWELMRLRSQMALARLGMESTVKVQRDSGHS
ncbi:RAB3A interacting protein [Desmophyllum pertusum]|uniref:RAB3A interacting protein n=1 Tax=Desmophyllum pertusum TaxID=174260 RepID=A0A9W9YAL1_9CNID|nr:RAB3A interacting protein [Desmophyllum pertusum]